MRRRLSLRWRLRWRGLSRLLLLRWRHGSLILRLLWRSSLRRSSDGPLLRRGRRWLAHGRLLHGSLLDWRRVGLLRSGRWRLKGRLLLSLRLLKWSFLWGRGRWWRRRCRLRTLLWRLWRRNAPFLRRLGFADHVAVRL